MAAPVSCLPLKERAAAVPVSQLPGSLPTANIPDDTDPAKVVKAAVKNLNLGLRADSLTDQAQWRDLFALTGTLRTFFGPKGIEAAWRERSMLHEPTSFSVIPGSTRIIRRGPKTAWVQGLFSFATHGNPPTTCSGIIGLVPDENSSSWKIWVLSTILERVQGVDDVDVLEPEVTPETNGKDTVEYPKAIQAKGTPHVNGSGIDGYSEEPAYAKPNGQDLSNGHTESNGHAVPNGDELHREGPLDGSPEMNGDAAGNGNGITPSPVEYGCVVCGGGQAGLAIAGRLKAGGVSDCVVLDKNDIVGGIWQNRYDSVKLHTSKDISQLPFGRIFPPEDPYYLGKEHLVRGYQKFVKQFGLNVWTSTFLEHAWYDAATKAWTLSIVRNGARQIITTKHLVLAIGPGGTVSKMPTFPNRETFKGQVMHSVNYMNCKGWAGKKGVIIGSANTAHDIADDMLQADLESVTMVQRSKTCVVPVEYMRANIEPIYGPTSNIEATDRMFQTMPLAFVRQLMNQGMRMHAVKEPERFDALDKVGFKVDRDVDMIHILFEKIGGHYMDVGTSAKVASGQVCNILLFLRRFGGL
jgi:thioredoxin reductase